MAEDFDYVLTRPQGEANDETAAGDMSVRTVVGGNGDTDDVSVQPTGKETKGGARKHRNKSDRMHEGGAVASGGGGRHRAAVRKHLPPNVTLALTGRVVSPEEAETGSNRIYTDSGFPDENSFGPFLEVGDAIGYSVVVWLRKCKLPPVSCHG